MRNLFTLLLLATFGVVLLAGPHPCMAFEEKQESPPPSCHQTAGPSNDLQVRSGAPSHSDGQDCCDPSCLHTCHAQALFGLKPRIFAMVPVSVAVAETPRGTLPQFAPPIDHIPLV